MGMLKEQDIFVRSHLSPLTPEQVALMRARWEREKRKQKKAPELPNELHDPPTKVVAAKTEAPVEAAPQRERVASFQESVQEILGKESDIRVCYACPSQEKPAVESKETLELVLVLSRSQRSGYP